MIRDVFIFIITIRGFLCCEVKSIRVESFIAIKLNNVVGEILLRSNRFKTGLGTSTVKGRAMRLMGMVIELTFSVKVLCTGITSLLIRAVVITDQFPRAAK